MADDRRIIFSTHVVPKESADFEETTPQAWSIMRQDTSGDAIAKTLGGKGTCTDLNATQWNDSWTSMSHPRKYWEDWADADDITGNRWEDVGYWDTVTVTTAAKQLSGDVSDLSFCYIKNKGSTNDIKVSVNGSSGNYYILIPPKGSVYFRGGGHADFNCNLVYIKAVSGSTTAEFVIAQK